MLWVPCFRIDLPVDAAPDRVTAIAGRFEALLDVAGATPATYLNLAVSGAAIRALVREGRGALLERLGGLVARAQVELLATAMHDALLPLLPDDELARQLDLNDAENTSIFGDLYQPTALWPPRLAFSAKVAHAAARRSLGAVLVDEAASRCWPAGFAGDHLPAMDELPGLFLVPASRALSAELAEGRRGPAMGELVEDSARRTFRVSALDMDDGPATPAIRPLEHAPSLRLDALFGHVDLRRTLSPMPSSALSTPDELGHGLPFAAWFSPGNPLHARQWRIVAKLHDLLRELRGRGLEADPRVRALRQLLDESWREAWWRAAGPGGDPQMVGKVAGRIAQAVAAASELVPPARQQELDRLLGEVGKGTTPAAPP